MSIKRDRTKLKTYFETGDRPTEEEFAELIDSGINQKDDEIHVVNSEIDPDKAPNLKVGVGTDSPKEKLHVEGSIMTSGHLKGDMSNKQPNDKTLQIINDAQIQLYSKDHNSAPGRVVIGANKDSQDSNSGAMIFAKHLTQGGWEQNMIIDHDGNVGVGTNTPQEKLHVDGNTEIEGDLQVKKDIYGDDHDWGRLNINASKKGYLGGAYLHMNGSNLHMPDKNGNMVDDGNQGGISFVAAGKGELNGFNFYHYNQERADNHINKLTNKGNSKLWDLSVRIDGFGNVGIGASNPQNKLVVYNGADQVDGVDNDTGLTLPTGKGAGKILTSDSDGKAFWRPATDVTNGLWIDEGNGNIRNGNSGSVKITANTLLVESQANNAHTWLPYTDGEIYLTGNEDGSGTGDIHFRSYSLNDGYKHHMVVKGDGNVGIGVNPMAKLDIVGKAENENGHGILKVGGAGTGKDLRLGVEGGNAPYTWIQSHGSVPLKLNPHPAGNTTTINENGGNVGIKTDDPKEAFQIGDRFVYHDGGSKVLGYNFKYVGGGVSKRQVNDGVGLLYLNGGSFHFRTGVSGAADSKINSTNSRLMIQNDGNVGIGTSSPNYKLDVNGDANFNGKLTAKGSPLIRVQRFETGPHTNVWIGPHHLYIRTHIKVSDYPLQFKLNHFSSGSVGMDSHLQKHSYNGQEEWRIMIVAYGAMVNEHFYVETYLFRSELMEFYGY